MTHGEQCFKCRQTVYQAYVRGNLMYCDINGDRGKPEFIPHTCKVNIDDD